MWPASELVMLVLLTSTVCILVMVAMGAIGRRGSRRNLPPGPLALPIIGHLHLVGKRPHRSFCDLSKTYGPLMFLRLGSVPIIVASTPEMAREILQRHDKVFSSRFRTAACEAIYGSSTSFTFSDTGPYLKFLRQLCTTELFSAKRMSSFEPIRMQEVGALIRSLAADSKSNKSISVRPKLQNSTSNIICRMVMGEASPEIVPVLLDVIEALGGFNLGDYIPLLRWMDWQGYVKHSKLVAGPRMKAAFQAVIDRRREQRQGMFDPPADLLDIVLSATLSCPQNIHISDEHIQAVLQEIIGGGSDTSALLIEWALAELLANPTKMKTLQEELESVVGSARMVQESDIPSMPYLMAVIKETMRLHPIITFLIPRQSAQPCQVAGYNIPANTQAYVNTWAIGRDPNVWERPLVFEPERFLCDSSHIDVRGQNFELLPFGSGRRGCLGWSLGLLNVQNILASLVQSFNWSVDEHELDMSEKLAPLMVKVKPLLARITPKLSETLLHNKKNSS
eukprot:c39974_g1_i1 orf=361-1884(-)